MGCFRWILELPFNNLLEQIKGDIHSQSCCCINVILLASARVVVQPNWVYFGCDFGEGRRWKDNWFITVLWFGWLSSIRLFLNLFRCKGNTSSYLQKLTNLGGFPINFDDSHKQSAPGFDDLAEDCFTNTGQKTKKHKTRAARKGNSSCYVQGFIILNFFRSQYKYQFGNTFVTVGSRGVTISAALFLPRYGFALNPITN